MVLSGKGDAMKYFIRNIGTNQDGDTETQTVTLMETVRCVLWTTGVLVSGEKVITMKLGVHRESP